MELLSDCIDSYTRIGSAVDYSKTIDYILERNLMKYQQSKMAVIFLFFKIGPQMLANLSKMSEISIYN